MSTALRHAMSEQNVTLDQVAEHLGRSRGYVSERTTAVRELTLDVVAGVANLTHRSELELLADLTERARTQH